MGQYDGLKSWEPGQSGNPNGRPKGARNWSSVVRDLLEDEEFTIKLTDGDLKKYPARVIAEVMIRKSMEGDVNAAKWLRETGYGNKLDLTSGGEKLPTPIYGGQSGRNDDTTPDV